MPYTAHEGLLMHDRFRTQLTSKLDMFSVATIIYKLLTFFYDLP